MPFLEDLPSQFEQRLYFATKKNKEELFKYCIRGEEIAMFQKQFYKYIFDMDLHFADESNLFDSYMFCRDWIDANIRECQEQATECIYYKGKNYVGVETSYTIVAMLSKRGRLTPKCRIIFTFESSVGAAYSIVRLYDVQCK